nr:retrovirus-related Pol polyprotein from transposon TNT 1-94 [Tanacetum cinerariifolium]
MFATCMCARYQANPNEHHVSAVKRIFRYHKGTINLGLWYLKDSGFDLTAYSDADHAGCHLDRKSTSGSVQFLGDKLVCWSSNKQNYVSISTAQSEYVAVSSCCAQVQWMRTQLTDYGFFYDKVPIYCDSKSAIAISCNLVQHTLTKHIDVRYHFIKDHVEKRIIELYFVGTEYQLADLFTKSLPEARFKFLVEKLGIILAYVDGVTRVNKRHMEKHESKVYLGKPLDASLVIKESNGTESGKYDTRSTSGNDAYADIADIKPI